MKFPRLFFLVCGFIGFTSRIASAHHGKDFLLLESYDVPHPGEVYLVSSAGIDLEEGETTLELEPAVLVGVLPRLAFELHGHITKEPEEALRYEATAPSLHLQITPPESGFPIDLGLSAEYEFASAAGANDRIETRLVAERAIGRAKLVGNLIVEHERGGNTTPGYGVGVRYELVEQFACGVEAQGPFTRADNHELLVGIYSEPNERITLKGGVGATLSDRAAGFLVRVGMVWRLWK